MPETRRAAFAWVATLVAVLLVLFPSAPGAAEPVWAPADQATIHPGVQTFTAGGQCTANFVFFDPAAPSAVFLGQAAHCAGTDGNTATNGCEAGSLPLGTPVEIDGASEPGTLVYSSWVEMQENDESDESTCELNDFALVRIAAADLGRVNPTIPFWGGPNAPLADSAMGEDVYSYGNSSLRLGLEPLSPKQGVSFGESGDGWNHAVVTVTPGIPGDSGSAFLDSTGAALGVLVTLQIAPVPGSNGVTDIGLATSYMKQHAGIGVSLALGTEPFAALI